LQKEKGASKILMLSFGLFAIAGAVSLLLYFLKVGLNISSVGSWLPYSDLLACTGLAVFSLYRKSLSTWIFSSMILGAFLGYYFPEVGGELNVLSKIFMKLVKSIIAPLLFGTLVVGIAGHSTMKEVGRMGLKALIYFEVVTTIALFIGLAAINISGAGYGIVKPANLLEELPIVKAQSWKDIVLHTFPENFAKSVADGEVLQIVVFCLFFAFGLTLVPEARKRPVLTFAESLSEVMFRFTDLVMLLAPLGVGGAMAYTVANLGFDVFKNLLLLVGTLYAALIVFVVGVLLPIAISIRIPLKAFIRAVREPVTLAFATASSEAALPKALENMRLFGVPDKVVSFVLPTGYSFNLDGTTLYLSLASVFVAQAAGVQLTFGQQLVMVFTLMLTSKGVAGVARASLVILAATAASFGLPEWPIAAILGVDALMDMARTSVNVVGNCLASVVVAKWEGELQKPQAFVND
jgi:proton glutamate symport protein